MHFEFSFLASTAVAAKMKLRNYNAPTLVKALVEQAIDAACVPTQSVLEDNTLVTLVAPDSPATLLGFSVEVTGRWPEPASCGVWEIKRLVVRPLYVRVGE